LEDRIATNTANTTNNNSPNAANAANTTDTTNTNTNNTYVANTTNNISPNSTSITPTLCFASFIAISFNTIFFSIIFIPTISSTSTTYTQPISFLFILIIVIQSTTQICHRNRIVESNSSCRKNHSQISAILPKRNSSQARASYISSYTTSKTFARMGFSHQQHRGMII
jgi:hypothetical protein